MRKAILMSFVAASMMTSCSSDEELSNVGEKFNGNVTLTAEPYTFEDGDTRTTLANTGNKIAFAWDDDETIGIFPIAPTTNVQAKQVLKNGSGNGTTSSFDGAGWALMYGNTYAAYYPYQQKEYEDYTKIPIDMTGQVQNGNDYMYANATVPTNGNVNFDFKHATSIIMLELTMPDAATWQSLTLASKSGDKVFTTSAAMNVATGTVTSNATSSEVTLSLNNVSTTASNNTLTLYLAVLPATTGELTLTAETSAAKSYTATLAGKTLVAGKAYRFTASPTTTIPSFGDGYENGYAYVDLNLPSRLKWATMNVGATSVTDYGKYYAWGETKAYGEEDISNGMNYNYAGSYTKTYYHWKTYKLCQGTHGSMIKYGHGSNIYKTRLTLEDDVAAQSWGGTWRMPTNEEQEELVNNCYWVWTSSYNGSGVAGYIVYATKSPSDKGQVLYDGKATSSSYSLSDTHIFVPVAGARRESSFYGIGISGCYWSSTLYGNDGNNALCICIASDYCLKDYFTFRYEGNSVRAVCE